MPHPERVADPLLGLEDGAGFFLSIAAWQPRATTTKVTSSMSTDKPSRNEDEYFAQQDAELLKKQREQADKAALDAERKSHYMKCPKDGFDLDQQRVPRRADRDLSALRRHVARRR